MTDIESGVVSAIYIASSAGEPMQLVDEVQAVHDKGLVGDRYADCAGFYSYSKRITVRHVSLIDRAAIVEANERAGTGFTEAETRRNIVTEGIDLNSLVDQTFTVGHVAMVGIELCTPCARPSKLSDKSGFQEAFNDRGGLRAKILSDGHIGIGDLVVISPPITSV